MEFEVEEVFLEFVEYCIEGLGVGGDVDFDVVIVDFMVVKVCFELFEGFVGVGCGG